MITKPGAPVSRTALDSLGYLFGLAAFIWPPLAAVALLIALVNLRRGRASPAIAQLVLAGSMAILGGVINDACVPSRTGVSHTGKPLTAEEVAGRISEARTTLHWFVAILCGCGILTAWRTARTSGAPTLFGLRITAPRLVWAGFPLLLVTFYGLSIITWRVLHPAA